ncbi:HTH domain-containing protein [Clostridioides sp. ES-S-0001-02]|uniref:HTH domain-containing protein n=1 Tax=Clostridioides sp. ES-S-0001-02 TaxID=2770770 RepID=UPI001D12C247|nr:hypothetical protein [Clostridioides sp. ES-S-0001-02]
MEVKKIDSDYIEPLLNKLIDEYHINEDILSNLIKIESEKLRNYKKYEKEFTADLNVWARWINFVLQLEYTIDVDSDSRLRGILSLLIEIYEINIEFIAKVAHVEEQYLVDFINGVDYVPTEVKYSICATAMNLSLIFKNKEI